MKYYIIAGEASGDLHGGNLMRSLLARDPSAQIRYWGGDRMFAVAAEMPERSAQCVRHIRDLAYMGFVEVVSHLSVVLGNIRYCKRDILDFNPDIVVFMDSISRLPSLLIHMALRMCITFLRRFGLGRKAA